LSLSDIIAQPSPDPRPGRAAMPLRKAALCLEFTGRLRTPQDARFG